MGYRCS